MMSPGRGLDALIAEKVMGWVCDMDEKVTFRDGSVDDLSCANLGKFCGFHCPNYSTDISAAFEVINKLKHLGPYIFSHGKTNPWTVIFLWGGQDAKAENIKELPHAICLAALNTAEAMARSDYGCALGIDG